MSHPTLTFTPGGELTTVVAAGPWIAAHSHALERLVDAVSLQQQAAHPLVIDIASVEQLDTLGAWLLERLVRTFHNRGQIQAWSVYPTVFVACSTRYMV